jgi:predicted small lipoprotein YifL
VFSRLIFVVLMASTLALAGCGRKGPLEPPPGAPPDEPRKVVKPVAKPQNEDAVISAPQGLFRSTGSSTEPPPEEQKKAKRPNPFILDPLL